MGARETRFCFGRVCGFVRGFPNCHGTVSRAGRADGILFQLVYNGTDFVVAAGVARRVCDGASGYAPEKTVLITRSYC